MAFFGVSIILLTEKFTWLSLGLILLNLRKKQHLRKNYITLIVLILSTHGYSLDVIQLNSGYMVKGQIVDSLMNSDDFVKAYLLD